MGGSCLVCAPAAVSFSSRYPSGPSPPPPPTTQAGNGRSLPPCPATAHSLEGALRRAARARAAANADDARSRAAPRAVTSPARRRRSSSNGFSLAPPASSSGACGIAPVDGDGDRSGRASSPSLAKGTVVRCASCVLGCASTRAAPRREISRASMEEAPAPVVVARESSTSRTPP